MMICSVCSHSERASIDACLVSNGSLRDIAGQFRLSRSALDRHKKHIPKHLTLARDAEKAADATSLLSRVEGILSRCEALADKAEAKGKWSGAVAAIKEMRGCLELIGKLSGELQRGGCAIQVNVGVAIENGKGAIVGTDQLFTTAAMSDAQLDYFMAQLEGVPPIEERRIEWSSRAVDVGLTLQHILMNLDRRLADPALQAVRGDRSGMMVRTPSDSQQRDSIIEVNRFEAEKVVAALRSSYELIESTPF